MTKPTASSPHIARQIAIDLSVMTVIGIVLGFIGPFGSFNDPLALRLVYWLGLSYAGYCCYRPVGELALRLGSKLELPEWGSWTAACLVATVPMTAIVWSLGWIGREWRWPTLEQAFYTYASVLLIGAGITVVFHLAQRRQTARVAAEEALEAVPATAGESAAQPRFLDRLPPALGSELLALEMEDHYVRAHTALGSELVLMRMRDAAAELSGIEGMQVHRSWWVARSAVEDVKRDGRNIRLVLGGGLEAPVSRANVQPLKDAGWF